MKIEPMPNVVYLKTEAQKVGNWDTSSKDSAVEFAEVVGIGEGVKNLKVGDKVFVKAWAIDLVNHEGIWYKFCNLNTDGILAIIHE